MLSHDHMLDTKQGQKVRAFIHLQTMHARIQKVLPEGSNSDVFISDNEGERIQIPLKLGHHRPASETPFKWRLAGGQIMAEH